MNHAAAQPKSVLTHGRCRAGRRLACFPWLVVLAVLFAATGAAGQPSDAESAGEWVPDGRKLARIEAAIDGALAYLSDQQAGDGSWPSAGNYNGVNAMAVLAFLGRGHEPGRGPYAETVDNGLRHLISRQRDSDGYLGGSMYDHALATLAMIEAYGFVGTDDLRDRIQRAIDVIVRAQSPAGGWRYNPVPADADLSVTVMQIVTLHAARNARFRVPEQTFQRAQVYVKSCWSPQAGFAYMPGSFVSPALNAGGVLSLQLLGAPDDPRVRSGLANIHDVQYVDSMRYFHYFNYYAMQANFQAGGNDWARWHPRVRDMLLSLQLEDGSFNAQAEANINGSNRVYSTAMAAMSLEVYLHYLPAYQR